MEFSYKRIKGDKDAILIKPSDSASNNDDSIAIRLRYPWGSWIPDGVDVGYSYSVNKGRCGVGTSAALRKLDEKLNITFPTISNFNLETIARENEAILPEAFAELRRERMLAK